MQHTATSSSQRTAHGKKLTPLCLALSALLLHSTAALADTVTYTGTASVGLLQDIQGASGSLGTPTGNFAPGVSNGYSNSTSGNTVTVNDVGATAPIGGHVYGAIHMGVAETSHNIVNIIDGYIGGYKFGSRVYGALNNGGNANFNTVNMTGGTVDGRIYGAYIQHHSGGIISTATGNSVNISGGTLNEGATGAYSSVTDANNNSVFISGGTIGEEVSGGGSGTGNANNNTVTITGGTIIGGGVGGAYTRTGSATNNTVTISGNPTFNTSANPAIGTTLYGGFSLGSGDVRSGNTLNLRTTNVRVNSIINFANIYFYLPTTTVAGDTVLTLTNAGGTNPSGAPVARGADITKTTIGVGIAGGTPPLQTGDSITLIKTTGGDLLTDANNLVNNVTGMQGVSLLYEFTLSKPDSSTLLATVGKSGLNPQTKSLSEGRAAGPAFINQGADLTANAGMANAQGALQTSTTPPAFGAISAGSVRYKTGSHIDVKGVNFLVGASAGLSNSMGPLMLGGFFEAGSGNYDSYNSFVNAASVHGSGDNRYYGAGILARQHLANNFYAEGSVRLGRLENDYSSVISGNTVHYDLDNMYTGAHLGAGHIIPLTNAHVDVYGKYFWSRQASAQSTILGDVYSFDAINSHRTRLGASYTQQIKDGVELKGGLAWEHEFDGKAKASVQNLPIATPELKGSSAVAELGVKVSPQNNLSFEVGVQGYAGKRQGVTGSLAVKYKF